jgi:hypothetical protein
VSAAASARCRSSRIWQQRVVLSADLGEALAARGTRQQLRAQPLLQGADALADHDRRDAEARRCRNECARRGLAWGLIEKRAGQSQHSRALGTFARTLEISDMAGLAGPFLSAANRVTQVAVVTRERCARRSCDRGSRGTWRA